ncbi:MAG: DUF1638 domain-containing protein [Acidimicrobiales bacterium]|jgi:hypothetical protein|nr:hypothetical protein [Acidimicrobiaceae bacterium]MDP6161497.1 DUF1638 domain-containing protein [Acidimicrobiales bacterium]HJL91771.1 DUF1638 domain-containing protein [Acidimicrobiales bacterium]HJO40450.1 DUF1638 domain-containing protein [Acidimicrobiales bacterium]
MSANRRTLIIACGALARELSEVISVNNLEHIDVECLPASYHNSPEKIPNALEERILKTSTTYDQIFVGYADCGTGGKVDEICEKYGLTRLSGAHCYEFFAEENNFADIQEKNIGSFYLTDFLVKHFERLVVKALWLDTHPELLNEYFGNYTQVVYLAQTNDPKLENLAREAAKKLGLELIVERNGYGDLETEIVSLLHTKKNPQLISFGTENS